MNPERLRTRGFTLVEAVVALAILMMATAGLMSIMVFSEQRMLAGRVKARLAAVTREQSDKATYLAYDLIADTGGAPSEVEAGVLYQPYLQGAPRSLYPYRVEWSVTANDVGSSREAKVIDIALIYNVPSFRGDDIGKLTEVRMNLPQILRFPPATY